MADSVEGLGMSRITAPTYLLVSRALYHCQGSGEEEFGLSGKGRIQTEEDRAGCEHEDIVKAGYERASRELCWELGEERWDGSS